MFPYVLTKGGFKDLLQQKDAQPLFARVLLPEIINRDNLDNLLAAIIDK